MLIEGTKIVEAERILCPIDFSESSRAAFEYACWLSRCSDSTLFIVHVEALAMPYLPGDARYDENLDENRRLLTEARPSPDINFEQHYLKGDVVDAILRFANLREIDLIILGTHGRTGLAKLLMGSVAESVVRRAPCPVLALRHGEARVA